MATFMDEAALTGATPAGGATGAAAPRDARFLDEESLTGVAPQASFASKVRDLGSSYGEPIRQLPTASYDTSLSPSAEAKFRKQYPNAQDTEDYDLRGAVAAGLKPDERGHLPDTYKKPNHITFSDESQYHGVDGNVGGKWKELPGGKWSFTPGATNLKNYSPQELKDYFVKNEPDATLVLPQGKQFASSEGGAATGVVQQKGQKRSGVTTEAPPQDIGAKTLGALAQASDLFTSGVSGFLGLFSYAGARLDTALRTKDQALSAQAAGMLNEKLFPSEVSAPFSKVAERAGPAAQKAYQDNPVAYVMGLVGDVIDKGADAASSKNGLQPQDIKTVVNAVMGAPIAKAFKAGTLDRLAKAVEKVQERPAAEAAPAADTSVPYDTSPAAEGSLVDQKKALDTQIKAAQAVDKQANTHVREAAKFAKMAEKLPDDDPLKATLQERSAVATKLAQQVRDEAAAAKETEVRAAAAEKAADIEERIGGSAYEPAVAAKPSETSPGELFREATEMQAVAQKPGALRTPEEMIKLRAWTAAHQRGFSDAKVAAGILAGSLTGAALYKVYQAWHYNQQMKELQQQEDDRYDRMEKRLDRQEQNRRMNEEHPLPNPGTRGREWTADAGGVAIAALVAARLKGEGTFHPKAVEALVDPLVTRMIPTGVESPHGMASERWAEKAVRNYANKHLATEGDPLANVELPSGKTWGETVKAAAGKETVAGPRGPESQFDIPDQRAMGMEGQKAIAATNSLSSYLSHVGDYLRQNVDPAKLPQYDLVRAVKETAANDARVAKEMEKAAAASMKDMPVYKEYPDGMRWVELKLPEKLTAEQRAKIGENGDTFTAQDAAGKDILNSYTQERAQGSSPEEAHLAGRLAEEGNQMGHCVGGYCADVASGETRILSLRDAKGRSHVTVEIAPPEAYKGAQAAGLHDGETSNILQIKGKQNRAPDSRYLPYVQDLVKEGKWGEVGDLGNTGLRSKSEMHSNELAMYKLQGVEVPDYMTPDEMFKFRSGERGSVDPKLLAGIAAVAGGAALGAYLDPQNPIHGGLYGAVAGALATKIRPRAIAEAVQRATAPRDLISIEDLSRQTVYARGQAKRAAYQLSTHVEREVPNATRREAIFAHLDGNEGVKLTPREAAVAKVVRQFYDILGAAAKKAGVVRELLDDYATRIYGRESQGLLASKMVGGQTGLDSPFGKRRAFPTLAEAEAAGHHPITTDISKVVEAYSDSVTSAMENRNYIASLRAAKTPEGTSLIAKEGKAPRDYVFIDHPQLRGLRVHPDIAADLRFIFDQTQVGPIIRSLDAINTTQKRAAVMFSLFHATALEHALLGATSILKSPGRAVRIAAQSFAPAIFGENLAVKMIREGGAGDAYDSAMKAGLKVGLERQSPALQELRSGFYEMMDGGTKFLDSVVPKLGTATLGTVTAINHMFDRAMWGRFHTALKMETWADKVAELSRNDARRPGPQGVKSLDEIHRAAASFTNDVFGGLDWQGISREFTSRWGRELASAAFSPTGRLGMRTLLFAPDWTISTTRAFLKAFGKAGALAGAAGVLGSQIDPDHPLVGGLMAAGAGALAARGLGLKSGGSGIAGLLRPRELADLHRQYILRSALIYSVLVDALNVQMSGHHFWDNKDPTRLDRGDGTTQQVSKHFMEPIHWLLSPRQQALNKLSFVAKEPLNQIMDTDYLSVSGAPRMGKTPKGEQVSLGTRAAHVARAFDPISVQQSYEGGASRSLAGFLGAPIYGRTSAERAAAKAEAKKKAIQRRIEKRNTNR